MLLSLRTIRSRRETPAQDSTTTRYPHRDVLRADLTRIRDRDLIRTVAALRDRVRI